ncbi:MAG: transcription termination/antitermination protein NusG [Candidatus Hodarchaeota archaeon]
MNTIQHTLNSNNPGWYALYTKFRHEFRVKEMLMVNNFDIFLPVTEVVRQWWDRKKRIQVPLFYCYIFVHCLMDKKAYYEILTTKGVVKVVGNRWPNLSRIPDYQIESIQIAINSRLHVNVLNELKKGDIAQINSGVLKGVQGILIRNNQQKSSLVISVDCMNRSLEVEVDCNNIQIDKVSEIKDC